jgi:hypothetical protein
MNKYISDYVKNKVRFLEKKHGHKKTKAIENAVRKLLHTGAVKVKHIGNNQENNKRAAGQKLSRMLNKIELTEEIEAFSIKNLKERIEKNTVIAYDLTDIAKPYAKKMEKLSTVFDGSKRQKEKGYFLHGLGIKEGLLSLRVADQDAKFLPTERKEILEKFLKSLDYKGIWTFDRGNDDQKLFRFLEEKQAKFIIRLKNNRKVRVKIYESNTSDFEWSEWMNLEDLPVNDYEIQIKSGESYRLVIEKNLENKAPIKLISNLEKADFDTGKVVELYLGRWCIEQQFKTMKTKFSLEEIQVRSFAGIKNLVALVHLSIHLAQIFWYNLSEDMSPIWRSIYHKFKMFCEKQALNLSFDAATFFFQHSIPDPFSSFLLLKKPPQIQPSLIPLPFFCDF